MKKKSLLLLLCLGVLLGAVILSAVLVSANDGITVERIAFAEGCTLTQIEKCGGFWSNRYNNSTEAYEDFYYYRESDLLEDAEITVYYTDGSSETVGYYNEDPRYDFSFIYGQQNNPWTVGGENVLAVTLGDLRAECNVIIVESPLERIEVINDGPVTLVENGEGEWKEDPSSQDGTLFFEYSIRPIIVGVEYKLVYKNGREVDTVGGLWSDVDGYGFGWKDNQFESHWVMGGNNILTIDIMGCSLDIPVEIVPNPVESLEIVEGTVAPLLENVDGWINSCYDHETESYVDFFFYSQSKALMNAQLKVNYVDGGYDVFEYNGNNEGNYLIQWTNDQENVHWTAGGENIITVSYMGKTLDFNVEIVSSPVESLEVVEGTLPPVIENTNGYINQRYDEATDSYVDYFEYSLNYVIRDLKLKVNYNDGTYEIIDAFTPVNEHCPEYSANQHNEPWTVGGNNILTVKLLGAELSINVVIEENPIERIEVIPETIRPLIENFGGEWETRYDPETDSEVEFYRYYLGNTLQDARYRIYYTDGTDEEFSPDGWSSGANQYDNPWTVGGNNIIHVEFEIPPYGRMTVDVNVPVIESPVESIEPVGSTDFSIIEYTNGELVYDYDEETDSNIEYFCYNTGNIIDNLKLRINYKDGRDSVEAYAYEEVDGYCFSWDHEQRKTPWTIGGENLLCVDYLGAKYYVNVEILPNPVESLEVVEGTLGRVIENVNGQYDMRYDEELGCDVQYFNYYLGYIIDELQIRINYKDGTHKVTSVYNSVDGQGFSWYSNQYSSPWVIGGDNKLFIEFMGNRLDIDIVVEPYPIERIELVEGTADPLIENADGHWEYRYNEDTQSEERFFWYSSHEALSDAQFRIYYKDGTDEIVDISSWSSESDQYGEPWTIGGENELTLHFYVEGIGEVTVVINIEIIPTPVESIEIVGGAFLELYENAGGHTSERYDEEKGEYVPFYYYEYGDMLSEKEMKVTFKDHTSVTFSLYEYYEGRQPTYYDDQFETPWTAGGNNIITVKFMGVETAVAVNILPNPVESIEILENSLGTLTEFADAYKSDYYDEETDSYKEYYYYRENKALVNAKIKVNYTDGSSETISVYDSLNGYSVSIYPMQDGSCHWTVGGENEVLMEFMGAEDTVSITIVPTPIESVEIVEGSIKPLIKDTDGYMDSYYDHETDSYVEFFHYDCGTIIIGAKLLVNFKDGSSVVLGYGDEYNGYGLGYLADQYQSPWTEGGDNPFCISYMGVEAEHCVEIIECPLESFTVDEIDFGELIYNDALSGYIYRDEYYLSPELKGLKFTVKTKNGPAVTYTLDDKDDYEHGFYFNNYVFTVDFGEEPAVIGKNTVTVRYMGMSAQVEIDVAESPVEYIKVIKAPDMAHYTKKLDKNDEGYRFEPIYEGIDFEIKYKNGNIITVSEHTAEASYMSIDGSYLYTITLDDGTMVLAGEDDGKYIATYRGAYCDIDCIEYTEGKEIVDFTVENFKYNGDGMSVTVEYADGTYETVTLDTVEWSGESDGSVVFGFAKTEKGMVTYYIINYDDSSLYRIFLLGIVIEYEYSQTVETGDADGDGEINSDDAIHLLYAVLFGEDEYELSQECDFDGNGEVNSDDAIYLLYHVLFGKEEYPLA